MSQVRKSLYGALLAGMGALLGMADPIQFNFTFTDPAGSGFNDPVYGTRARAALESAAATWSHYLPASYNGEIINASVSFTSSNSTATFTTVTSDNLLSPDGSYYNYPITLIDHLLGRNFNGDAFSIRFGEQSSSTDWYFGPGSQPGTGQTDFESTALHEIAHGLGFTTTLQADGTYNGYPSIYDRFTVNDSGTLLTQLTPAERERAATQAQGVLWSGSHGIAGNEGSPVYLFTSPGEFLPADTIAHIDFLRDSAGNYRTDLLMAPAFAPNTSVHTPDPITLGILEDIGWQVVQTPVPEPGGPIAMAIGVLCIATLIARQRSLPRSRSGMPVNLIP